MSIEHDFVHYLKDQRLSEKTIKKYSVDTPNCPSVENIIKTVTGTTKRMYDVFDFEQLDIIIEKVTNSDFDQTGHKMYSCGLKKYKKFLESCL